MVALGTLLRKVPGVRSAARVIDPNRRRTAAQWRRIHAVIDMTEVQSGPFAGMRLTPTTTGSDAPKRLGCYEAELHPLIESWTGYDRIIDVGCGEGWYVVGLARRCPSADVRGFDISRDARRACADMAAANGVRVTVAAEATPAGLADLVTGRTLLIVDAEGAEVDVLDPDAAPGLRGADILVEMHDFARPGATSTMLERFAERAVTVIEQQPRRVEEFPVLQGLDASDRARALDESRSPDQVWLWMPA